MDNFEKRTAFFDKRFTFIDGTREFLTYFESSTLHCTHLLDFVHEDNIKQFKKAFGNIKEEQIYLFRLKKNDGNYYNNLVQFENVNRGGEDVVKVKTTDIDELLQSTKIHSIEDAKIKHALCLTNEFVFTYEKATNNFTVYEYKQNRKNLIFDQNFDDWIEQMIKDNFVPEDEEDQFRMIVNEIKQCPEQYTQTITCAIRTRNPEAIENVCFTGVKIIEEDEVLFVGRILAHEHVKNIDKSKTLIYELQIDSLTQIYNKKTITKFVKDRIRENKNDHVAIIIVDLDHFKPVNDQYGHLEGDKVLVQAAKILKEIVGEDGFVGRFGGDEFMVMINNIENIDFLRGILQTMLTKIRLAFENTFPDVKITSSIGCSVHPDNGTTYEELFKKADFCLYRAKDKGRDRYVFFRDDLHKAEFEKADAAKTAGIKFDSREMQEIRYFSQFILDLDRNPKKAIAEVLDHMLETYALDSISIYYGEGMKRIYHQGKIDHGYMDAKYVNTDDFKKLIRNECFVRLDFWTDMNDSENLFLKEMMKRDIKSTIHCIIGTPDDIKGIVTFDRIKMAALFAEYEQNCCNIFSSCLNLQKQNVIISLLEGLH